MPTARDLVVEHALDPVATAERAGLRYVTDDRPGIRRRKVGTGFAYYRPDGALIRKRSELRRIAAIAIPPAWTDVWIGPNPNGHILATGRDARGRKQYRYHPEWRAVRDASKYDRMLAFGAALPDLRARIDRDLDERGVPREKVLAAVLHLIDSTLLRVGNDEYARLNESFGATTMRNDHATVDGQTVAFAFRGKHGAAVEGRIGDRRLARIVKRCQELPGEQLFGYVDELGVHRDVGSEDVNEYLREIAGQDFSVKDFRTWGASVLATALLGEIGPAEAETEATRRLKAIVRIVAHDLGNTAAVCRRSYIHPLVVDRYLAGDLPAAPLEEPSDREGLQAPEALLLELLAEA